MPLSDCEVRDPRMRRTRQLLQDALRELLKTKGFDELAVRDITRQATVNRATFYDHYTDKFALLDAMVAGGFHRLLAERKIAFATGCGEAVKAIVLAVCDYLVEARPGCQSADPSGAFAPLMEAAITKAVQRILQDGGSAPLMAGAGAGAIFGACKAWFESSDRAAADTAAAEIVRVVAPVVLASGAAAAGQQPHQRGQQQEHKAAVAKLHRR